MGIAIEARGVSKRYQLGEQAAIYGTLREAVTGLVRHRRRGRPREVWALRDLNLQVEQGELLGVIGRNGAGKTTLLKLVARITRPTTGVVRVRGRIGTLLEVGTGFHPELTGRENIFLNGAILGMSRAQIARRLTDIANFAGLGGEFLDTPLKRYSTGMQLRLAFAIAAHLESDVVVVDEVLAVGDAEFQQRCIGAMSDLVRRGRTVLFVSHDLGTIRRLCRRTVWLNGGSVIADGPSSEVVARYVSSFSEPDAALLDQIPEDRHATVVDASLLTPDGTPIPDALRGEAVRLRLRVRLREWVPGAYPQIGILDERGVMVVNEAWVRQEQGSPFDAPGLYDVMLVVPAVLTAGAYIVRAWIGTRYDDFVEADVLRFRVLPRDDDFDDQSGWPRAIELPDASWDVRAVESPVELRDR